MVYRRTQIKKLVKAFVNRLQKQANLPVDEVFLFGSYAWGKPLHHSDIDLAVISKKFNQVDDIRRIEILSDIARHIFPEWKIEIDVVGFTRDEINNAGYFELVSEIREKGQLVYKKAA